MPTSTGQKEAVLIHFWILSSRLARARRDLADIDDKNQKFKQILSKKCLSKLQNPKKSKFSLKNFYRESWIFAVFISLQNASKKRLGSCSIPGSASGSRSRAWTMCKMILFHAHFWTSKFHVIDVFMKFRCVTRPSLRRGYLWKPSERFHKSPFLLVTHNLIEFQERKRKRSTQKSENFHKVAKIGFDFQSCREWNVTQFFFPVLHRLT